MKNLWLWIGALVVSAFVLSVYVFPSFPSIVPVHWNASGNPDGFAPKEQGLFLLPVIMLGLALGFAWLRSRKHKSKVGTMPLFPPELDCFMPVILAFLLWVHVGTISIQLGWDVSLMVWIYSGLGGMFIYLGHLLPHISQNWMFGIRTPWTLANKTVWNKTHCAGGKLFKYLGYLALISIILPAWAFFMFIGSTIGVALYLLWYSYSLFQKQK